MSKNIFLKIALFTIAFFLLISLARTLNFAGLAEVFQNANKLLMFAAILTLIPEILIKSLRVRILISAFTKSSLSDALMIFFIGMPFGVITPGRAGDLIKIRAISQKTSLPQAKSLAIGIIEKIMVFFSLFALFLAGTAVLITNGKFHPIFVSLIIFTTVFGILAALFMQKKYSVFFAKFLYEKILPASRKENFQDGFDNFYSGVSAMLNNKNVLIKAALATFLTWFIIISRISIFAFALGIKAQFFYFFLVMPIIFMVEVAPVSFMGIGTREYAHILLFSFLGVTAEQAVSLSLTEFTIGTMFLAAIGYFAALKENFRRGARQ